MIICVYKTSDFALGIVQFSFSLVQFSLANFQFCETGKYNNN